MKKILILGLWVYLLGNVVGCSFSTTINNTSPITESIIETLPSLTSTTFTTHTIAPKQTNTLNPTITLTPTSTVTPTATPNIKLGNAVISRENVDQLTQIGHIGKASINDIAWSPDGEWLILTELLTSEENPHGYSTLVKLKMDF